jgi:1-acyl-sn-glycerol-3-phosphate acyltransferase
MTGAGITTRKANMPERLITRAKPASFTVRAFRPVAYAWLWATGFRIEGALPDLPKYVIIGVPHTTNWDLPHALAAGLHYGERVYWMGKSSIFKWPFGGMMRWLGGLSVERGQSANAVGAMIETMKSYDRLPLVIAPAGTRSATVPWKSGYYHIAVGAGVPIVLAFIDYKRRAVGIAGVFTPSGDYAVDLPKIQAMYNAVLATPLTTPVAVPPP